MRRKLIVPFVVCNRVELETYAWVFCKYADFCLKNDMPIIVEEEYCGAELVSKYHEGLNPETVGHTAPTPEVDAIQNKLKKIIIKKEEKIKYLEAGIYEREKENREKICYDFHEKFSELINLKLDEIEKQYGKVDVILTWVRYPALVSCAEKRGIAVITQELSVIRGVGNYKEVFGSFSFREKYSSQDIIKDYERFKEDSAGELFLARREILALILKSENLDVLNRLNEPRYEFGVDADADRDFFFSRYSDITQNQIFDMLDKVTDERNVLARFHPESMHKQGLKYDIDNSPNSLEWILKCRRIVSGISNVGFEAMLLGRTAYVLCDKIPYYLGNVHFLDYEREDVADLRVLNYLLFVYYTPWELMFDYDYICWRLEMPGSIDIYKYNLSRVLENIGTTYGQMILKSSKERYNIILRDGHDLSETQVLHYVKRVKKWSYSEFERRYNELEKKYNDLLVAKKNLEIENMEMKHSKSWRITEPLRRIRRRK